MKVNDCPICGKEISKKPTEYKKLKGLATCSKECRAEYLKTYYKGENNPNCKYKNESNIETFFRMKSQSIKASAKQRDLEFNLDEKYLYDLFEEQNGICYYSGIPLKLISIDKRNGFADYDVLSVDRIDSDKGYIKDNIVLCVNCINLMKGSLDTKTLQEIFGYITIKQSKQTNIKVKKLRENAIIPKRMSFGDVGYDLFVSKVEHKNGIIKVYSGIAVEPEIGVYLELYPRSSIYKKNLILANSVGIIDNSYRGEIMAIFKALDNPGELKIGERFAQLIPKKYMNVKMEESKELSDTERGQGGFGSTGK